MSADRIVVSLEGPLGDGIRQRFWRFVVRDIDAPEGCWFWSGSINDAGYGLLRVDGRAARAHRVSYAIHGGHLRLDDLVLHLCDEPRCVNPAHLMAGTQSENIRQCVERARHPRLKLTDDDVRLARRMHEVGATFHGLARYFGVDRDTIAKAVRGESWHHVR